jgi:hypothetical protein
MLSSKVMVIYRIIAVLILSMPMAVNIYIKAGIVSSIIYVPLITLLLSGITIFIDGKLEALVSSGMVLPKLKVPTGNIHIKTANDIMV